jgi:hypothetical protein
MVTGTGSDGEKLDYRACDLYYFRGDKTLNKEYLLEISRASGPSVRAAER